MAIKSYAEFVNENLVGQYSYYGAGSLFPIVSKLASEGKNPQQIYTYLTTLGIDEERKRKVLTQVFLNESIDFDAIEEKGGLYEDDLEDIAKADTSDLKKGIDPSKAKPDADVEAALDKLKSGDDEDMKDKEEDGDDKDSDEDKSEKIAALQAALKDAEKLDKIKKILAETFEMDFSEETDKDFITGIFEYHSVLEKLSKEEREKLKDNDFVFADTRSWPIHDEKHAKTALVWATWPQYANKKAAIVKAVIKKYPHLKGVGAAK
jgi:hypothetical protein